MRRFLSVLSGVVLGGAVVALGEQAGHRFYPLPEGVDPTNHEALRAAIHALPLGAFLVVLAAWALGAFVGGLVATLIARSRMPALAVGGIQTALGLVNVLAIPHPLWFSVLGIAVFVPFAWLGSRLVRIPAPA